MYACPGAEKVSKKPERKQKQSRDVQIEISREREKRNKKGTRDEKRYKRDNNDYTDRPTDGQTDEFKERKLRQYLAIKYFTGTEKICFSLQKHLTIIISVNNARRAFIIITIISNRDIKCLLHDLGAVVLSKSSLTNNCSYVKTQTWCIEPD